jgi:hypothetical protein
MFTILDLLKASLPQSILEASLKSMSESYRKKYYRGQSVRIALTTCQRDPQGDEQKSALEYYDSVMADVDKTFKAKLAELMKSNSACFIELLRLSGFPEGILCTSGVYQTIILAYVHVHSMSDHLRTICLDSPDLLHNLEAYSKLLAVFTPNIISEILKEIKKQEGELATDINKICMTQFCSFSQVLASLMQPNSVEFMKLQLFAIMKAAIVETDVSKWSPGNFETMKNCVVSILGNTKIVPSQKLEFLMQFVPKMIKLLEESTIWKPENTCFHGSFRLMFEAIHSFSMPGFVDSADYTTALQKFSESGFPHTLQDLSKFLTVNLWDNYNRLKDLKDQ